MIPLPCTIPPSTPIPHPSPPSDNLNNLTNSPATTPLPRAATLFLYFVPLSQSRTPTDSPLTALTRTTPQEDAHSAMDTSTNSPPP